MNRSTALLRTKYDYMKPNLSARRRPKYYDEPSCNVMNVKTLGAKGDGPLTILLDCHIHVGGAAGSSLQVKDCPKLSGKVNPKCKAASMLFHLIPGQLPTWKMCGTGPLTTIYTPRKLDQVDVYAARGMLIESDLAYLQGCLDKANCQSKAFGIEESYGIWIYNLCSKGIVEMVSPRNSTATDARENVNGFLSSILAWLQGTKKISGPRKFKSFVVYEKDDPERRYRGPLDDTEKTDSVCDKGCGNSLRKWFNTVAEACDGHKLDGTVPMLMGGNIWAGYNETCLLDKKTGEYCNDVIDTFSDVSSFKDLPETDYTPSATSIVLL
ncbi:hypothetical protein ACJZ2D_004127 [Fusarium nematophilum]